MADFKDSTLYDASRAAPPLPEGAGDSPSGSGSFQSNLDSGSGHWGFSGSGPGYPALYYDGKTAKGRRARFEVQLPDTLRIYDSEDLAAYMDWPAPEVIPTGALADIPMQLRRKRDTGERLSIEDPNSRRFARAWLEPRLAQARRRIIRRRIMAVGAAWAVIALIWLNMSPVMDMAAGLVPESWENEMGRAGKEQIARILTLSPTGEIPWCSGAKGAAALQSLARRLDMPMTADPDAPPFTSVPPMPSGAGERTPPPPAPGKEVSPVDIAVLDSRLVNAFALPGRNIVITSAMLKTAQSPDELAGVLAHEMGHVTERHSVKRLLRAYGLDLVFRLAAGQGDLFNAMGGLGYALAQNRFSRADEALADRLGVERMLASGLDPVPLADLFARIRDEESGGQGETGGYLTWEYLSDHPGFDSRIAAIRGLAVAAEQRLPPPTPALSREDWTALQNICAEE